MPSRCHRLAAGAVLALLVGCARPGPAPPPVPSAPPGAALPERAAAIAAGQVGTPYRHGGRTPSGFDCSGLVLYAYAGAGLRGLPHSAAALARRSRPVPLSALRRGDLLFFRLGRERVSHVAIVVGDGRFVHAPSSGRHVETVDFGHRYWGPRIRRAGRLVP